MKICDLSNDDSKNMMKTIKGLDERTMLRFITITLLGMNQEVDWNNAVNLLEQLKND